MKNLKLRPLQTQLLVRRPVKIKKRNKLFWSWELRVEFTSWEYAIFLYNTTKTLKIFKKLDNAIGNSLGISIPTVVKIVFRSVFGLPLKYKCSDEVTHTIRRRMDAPRFSACWDIIFSFKDAILVSASISHIINLHDSLWKNYDFKGCRL